jgi:UDP-N-acetylmuramoyl-tripeptide--D-alanyl-D-alanine ligase
MHWTLAEVARVTGGDIWPAGWPGERPAALSGAPGGDPAGRSVADAAALLTGVGIDSRTLEAGQLWVALRSERDGHDFATAAVAAGAGALLTERPTGAGRPEVVVADTMAALAALGRHARRRLGAGALVVGITGSVGKTSTKDLLAGALATRRRVVASPRSFNNELGLPLTLANAPDDAEVVVLEMGARGFGHIAMLCDIARPQVGVVTAVAAAHTEMLGDLDGVARAKSELPVALPAGGTAVLNGDDPRVAAMAARTAAAAVTYSASGQPGADLRADAVALDAELRPAFRAETPWGSIDVRLEARGAHQVANALAALAVAGVAGVALADAAAGLAHAALSPQRMDLRRAPSGGVVINDAYNANPASVAAALHALAAVPAGRRVAVLGPMAELGADGPAEHRRLAALAGELGIEVVAVGTDLYGVSPAESPAAVAERLGPVSSGTAVLVKASRVAALERVATLLLDNS